MDQKLADEARFLRTWLENPLGTGAVSPSSRALAQAMARCVDIDLPGPVIELGPGTGPVTDALIRHGVKPDRLVLVEFDPTFCQLLRQRYPEARVIEGDAYRLAETLRGVIDGPAAAIVSSLPLLTRPDRVRLDLLRQAFAMLRPGSAFVQFTYGMISPIPRRRHCTTPFDAQASAPVWLNLPPARVWVYRVRQDPFEADEHRIGRTGRLLRPHTWGAKTWASKNWASKNWASKNWGAKHGGVRPADSALLLKLKSGTHLLGEELRVTGRKIHRHLRSKAAEAHAELRAGAARMKNGIAPVSRKASVWKKAKARVNTLRKASPGP